MNNKEFEMQCFEDQAIANEIRKVYKKDIGDTIPLWMGVRLFSDILKKNNICIGTRNLMATVRVIDENGSYDMISDKDRILLTRLYKHIYGKNSTLCIPKWELQHRLVIYLRNGNRVIVDELRHKYQQFNDKAEIWFTEPNYSVTSRHIDSTELDHISYEQVDVLNINHTEEVEI